MRVLLIADGASMWTAKYVENVLVPLGHDTTLLTAQRVPPHLMDAYSNPGVHVVLRKGPMRLLESVPYLRRLSAEQRTVKSLRKTGEFDVVHILMALLGPVHLGSKIGGKRLAVSYLGSDLLRRSERKLRAMRRYLRRADVVTVNSIGMYRSFQETYADLGLSPDIIPFGVNGLDAIDLQSQAESREARCKRFSLPTDRIIVTVGYNGRPEQQHLMMLRAIAMLSPSIKSRIFLVVPMAYGGDADYISEVRESLCRTAEGVILTHFLNESDQARFALATDLFIHAQTTDAISATLQEFLYAGADVFNGSWLEYPELVDAGVAMHEFSSEIELTESLATAIPNFQRFEGANEVNRDAMRSRSWGSVVHRWASVYEAC